MRPIILDIHVLVYHFPDRHLPGHLVLGTRIFDRRGLDLLHCAWKAVLKCTQARDRNFNIRKLTARKDYSQKIVNESHRSRNLLNASHRQGFRMLRMDCGNAPDNLNGNSRRSRNGCSRNGCSRNGCSRNSVRRRNQRCGNDRHRHVSNRSLTNRSASWNSGEKESKLNLAITPLLRCANCTSRWNTSVATCTSSVSK